MSKGLEALGKLAYENACCRCQYLDKKDCSLNDSSCIWLDIKRELNALAIVKKCINSNETYRSMINDRFECGWITQEEYDLLKEVLL